MNFSEAVAIATASLWAHKLRSVLTLIGVVIGVAAVIAVVSLINGANQYVATKVFNLGADVFGLAKQPTIITNVDDFLEFQKRKRITYDDYEAVRELCKSCKEVGASLGGRVEIRSGLNSLKDTNLRAWTPQMAELYDVDLVEGRHITDADLRTAAPVCVIGMDIEENLLPGLDPVGREIRWNNIGCQIIGVGKKEGSSLGTSLDNWIILPLTTYMKEYGTQQDSLRLRRAVFPPRRFRKAWTKCARSSRAASPPPCHEGRFRNRNERFFLSLRKDISQSFFLVTIAIASISLAVGGIVIMNITLVSVTSGRAKSACARPWEHGAAHPVAVFDPVFDGRRNWRGFGVIFAEPAEKLSQCFHLCRVRCSCGRSGWPGGGAERGPFFGSIPLRRPRSSIPWKRCVRSDGIEMATIGKTPPQTHIAPLRGLVTRGTGSEFREQVWLARTRCG